MENGCVENWLHPSLLEQHEPKNLNFVQRLNIAIDVAYALEYLHRHCEMDFIHCDLKRSNILLDGDLCAHVSDFGLTKIFSTTNGISIHQQTCSIGIRRTIDYAAPEFMATKIGQTNVQTSTSMVIAIAPTPPYVGTVPVNHGKKLEKFLGTDFCKGKGRSSRKVAKAKMIEMDKMSNGVDVINLSAVVSKANFVGNPKEWWVDTGATRHINADKKMFTSYSVVDNGEQLFMGNSLTSKVEG
ncbi:unnamed protein product [Camellia sinensis]